MKWREVWTRAAALSAVLTVAACVAPATDPSATYTGQAAAAAVCCAPAASGHVLNGVSRTYNGWDVAFIEWLAPHDAVASQMAELAPGHSHNAVLKTLAAKIDSATAPRYLEISKLAAAWSKPIPSTDPNAATGHDHGGTGTSEAGDAETLTPLQGKKFDREFLAIMLAHHKAALPYAKSTIGNGVSPQARAMAQNLLTVQSAQIAAIQSLLKTV